MFGNPGLQAATQGQRNSAESRMLPHTPRVDNHQVCVPEVLKTLVRISSTLAAMEPPMFGRTSKREQTNSTYPSDITSA